MKERTTHTTLTIVSSGIASLSAKMADDLGAALNDNNLRILPVLGSGGFHNVSDVLHFAGVDVGLVHEDVLLALLREDIFPDMDVRLRYVARLNREPIFIIAHSEIQNLESLEGKVVNLGPGSAPLQDGSGKILGKTIPLGPGASAQHTTQALIVEALGIHVKPAFFDLKGALAGMRNGSVDAAVLIGTELMAVATLLNSDDHLRVIPITPGQLPGGGALPDVYQPVVISGGEYDIFAPGSRLKTVSVPLVMVTANWPRTSLQYDKVAHFVTAMLDNFASLRSDLRSPAWKTVNIAESVTGLERFEPVAAWIAANSATSSGSPGSLSQLKNDFQTFLLSAKVGADDRIPSADDRELFTRFLSWPQNPAKIKIPVHRASDYGTGELVGTLGLQNTEVNVDGREEVALRLQPSLTDMEPGERKALQISDDTDCRTTQRDGIAVASLAAGGGLWLVGADEKGPNDGNRNRRAVPDNGLPELPDIVADEAGQVTGESVVAGMSLADVAQRAIVIHTGPDQDSPRWACATIRLD